MKENFAKYDKVLGKLPEIPPEEEESYHDIDSDPELKKIIYIRKKQKPKVNFETGIEHVPMSSSESSLTEIGHG